MNTTDPAALVRRMYAAFASRDDATLRDVLADDVTWNQCAGFPGGARHRGRDAVLTAVFAGNRSTWDDFAAPIDELVAAGDRVIALGHYRGTHRLTGKPMHAVFAHVYRVRDGRIVHFEQIADTWPMVAAAQAACGPGDAPAG